MSNNVNNPLFDEDDEDVSVVLPAAPEFIDTGDSWSDSLNKDNINLGLPDVVEDMGVSKYGSVVAADDDALPMLPDVDDSVVSSVTLEKETSKSDDILDMMMSNGHSVDFPTTSSSFTDDNVVSSSAVSSVSGVVAADDDGEDSNSISTDFESFLNRMGAGDDTPFNATAAQEGDDYFNYFEDGEDEDFYDGFDIDDVLRSAIEQGASDVHIVADDEVRFTILGDIVRQPQFKVPTGTIIMRVEQLLVSHVQQEDFIQELELDASYMIKTSPFKGRRFRLNVIKSFGQISLTFRVISDNIPEPEDLGVEDELLAWTTLPSGLVLMNGPTGSGKTTTLAALLKRIQMTTPQKIITLERPIEFVYGVDGPGLVVQREIGKDARSFSAALTSAMRQAPNVIMVGEVRNRVEIDELIRAAETGHLAISTIHTNSAAEAVNRIMSSYEGDDQRRVLASLGDMSRGFANQVLLKSIDGKSRFAVREILEVDDIVAGHISKGDVPSIRKYQMERGITLDHNLTAAVKAGKCTLEDARRKSAYPRTFDELMRQ